MLSLIRTRFPGGSCSAHHPRGPMIMRGRQAGGTPESTVSAEPVLGFLLQGGEVGVRQRRVEEPFCYCSPGGALC